MPHLPLCSLLQAFPWRPLLQDLCACVLTLSWLALALWRWRHEWPRIFALHWTPLATWLPAALALGGSFPLLHWIRWRGQPLTLFVRWRGARLERMQVPEGSRDTLEWAAGLPPRPRLPQPGARPPLSLQLLRAFHPTPYHAALLAASVLLAPLWEEILLRGFVLPSLAAALPLWPAAAAGALLFAHSHDRLRGLAVAEVRPSAAGAERAAGRRVRVFCVRVHPSYWTTLLLGMLASAAHGLTGNLAAPIALHAAWNLLIWLEIVLKHGAR